MAFPPEASLGTSESGRRCPFRCPNTGHSTPSASVVLLRQRRAPASSPYGARLRLPHRLRPREPGRVRARAAAYSVRPRPLRPRGARVARRARHLAVPPSVRCLLRVQVGTAQGAICFIRKWRSSRENYLLQPAAACREGYLLQPAAPHCSVPAPACLRPLSVCSLIILCIDIYSFGGAAVDTDVGPIYTGWYPDCAAALALANPRLLSVMGGRRDG